ncbi:hypothetical protein [Janthinobacterium sp. JC611]|uniref:hypothetical protein n=1 Tax=Janthinobacterium sp. JC611 TaxID=2816201 RepID=UPI001BFEBED2|nr:hypothetical protein [Janthinobacterium sp. JC611]
MIRIGNIEEAWQVLEAIPEFDQRRSLAQLQERLPAGALPAHRKAGMAQRVLEGQEAWASAHGFAAVTVKSTNRYPAMLRLLIRNGYQIRVFEHFGDPTRERVHFIKPLF